MKIPTFTSSARRFSLIALIAAIAVQLNAQTGGVGIGTSTPDPSAVLDLSSDSLGLLIPRMTAAQRDAIANPATGLMVFITEDSSFYCFEGTDWAKVGAGATPALLVDLDGDTRVHVEENPDDDIIRFDLGGTEHFVFEAGRVKVKNTGRSVFIGDGAGAHDDLSNNGNVAVGDSSLSSNTTGNLNVALGREALYSNTTGWNNVALGSQSLNSNTTGGNNVALGYQSLYSNTTGLYNAALGYRSLYSNKTGNYNVTLGYQTLYWNETGNNNMALGVSSLFSNTTGWNNTALGREALFSNTTGGGNVAIGKNSLRLNETGTQNVAVGLNAGSSTLGDSSVFIGAHAGSNEVAGHRLYIENSAADSSEALIYGEFDNDLVRVNGHFIASEGLTDGDHDTKIRMDEDPDDDIIRFDLGGTEYFRMDRGRIEVVNTGASVFIGDGAGAHDNLTNNRNVAVGDSSLYSNTNGSQNVALGYLSLYSNTTGFDNVALGLQSLYSNTTGSVNTAVGSRSLYSNTEGDFNVALGYESLYSNTTGNNNTAIGFRSLEYNTTGLFNTALGFYSLRSNTTGEANTAVGFQSLYFNTTGSWNTALGREALLFNTEGYYNVALGYRTLYRNTTGNNNTALGREALYSNTSGENNVALGYRTLYSNKEGDYNVALGDRTLYSNTEGDFNVALGYESLYSNTTGNNNTALGREALYSNTTGGGNVAIGRNSLRLNETGTQNVAVGQNAGSSTLGDSSVFIGAHAGRNEVAGHRLYIENSDADASEALIYGEFDNDLLSFNGKVGIHTQSPTDLMHVYGGNFRADKGDAIQYTTRTLYLGGARNQGSDPYASIDMINYDHDGSTVEYTGARITSHNAETTDANDVGDMRFLVNNGTLTERMRITRDGDIGIGTTNPTALFQVGESGDGTVAKSNNWMTFSDRRYKENIKSIEGATNLVAKLSGVHFNWKESGRSDIGFIAQEIESVFPELVHTDHNGYKSVDYARVSAVLVEAVKEQQARQDALQDENAALRAVQSDMEKRMFRLEQLLLDQLAEQSED